MNYWNIIKQEVPKMKVAQNIKCNQQKQNQTKKMHKNKHNILWRNAPCCMNYIPPNISTFNIPRFQIGSIYHRDQVDKPKKVFNQFQKPDLLLQEYRRQIQETSHPKYNTAAKKNKEITQKQKNKARSMSMTAATSLYQVPNKIDYKYDIHGYREHHVGEYNVKQIEEKVKNAKRNFSFGRRVDLSRPLNFFPGPGTYDPEKTVLHSDNYNRVFAKTCTQFRKKATSAKQSDKMILTARAPLKKQTEQSNKEHFN